MDCDFERPLVLCAPKRDAPLGLVREYRDVELRRDVVGRPEGSSEDGKGGTGGIASLGRVSNCLGLAEKRPGGEGSSSASAFHVFLSGVEGLFCRWSHANQFQ